jgi:hypothetical protein
VSHWDSIPKHLPHENLDFQGNFHLPIHFILSPRKISLKELIDRFCGEFSIFFVSLHTTLLGYQKAATARRREGYGSIALKGSHGSNAEKGDYCHFQQKNESRSLAFGKIK